MGPCVSPPGRARLGWGAEPCCECRALLKVGTSLMDMAAVQELGEHLWWEQE